MGETPNQTQNISNFIIPASLKLFLSLWGSGDDKRFKQVCVLRKKHPGRNRPKESQDTLLYRIFLLFLPGLAPGKLLFA